MIIVFVIVIIIYFFSTTIVTGAFPYGEAVEGDAGGEEGRDRQDRHNVAPHETDAHSERKQLKIIIPCIQLFIQCIYQCGLKTLQG